MRGLLQRLWAAQWARRNCPAAQRGPSELVLLGPAPRHAQNRNQRTITHAAASLSQRAVTVLVRALLGKRHHVAPKRSNKNSTMLGASATARIRTGPRSRMPVLEAWGSSCRQRAPHRDSSDRWDTIKPERPSTPLPATARRGATSTFATAEHDLPHGSHLSFSRLALQSLRGPAGRRGYPALRQDFTGHAAGLLQRSPYNLVRIILGLPELFDAERDENVIKHKNATIVHCAALLTN